MIDVEDIVTTVNAYIVGHVGMKARDADGNDFGFEGDDYRTALHFKTGTSRGEVTVQVFHGQKSTGTTFRIVKEDQVSDILEALTILAQDHLRASA